MIERAMYYDVICEKWCFVEDSSFASKEIEDLPIVIIIRNGDILWIWCKEHNEFEAIDDIDGIRFRSRNGCEFYGLPAYFQYNGDRYGYSVEVPVRWRLTYRKDTSVVFSGMDAAKIQMVYHNANPFWRAPRIQMFTYENCVYDMSTGMIKYTIRRNSLPGEVASAVLELLKDAAGDLYGLRPSNLDANTMVDEVVFRPYDTNRYKLQGYFGKMDFIARDEKNAYHRFCEKLGILPPKSLKKFYAHNPFAIIIYRALLEMGFRDYNLMRPFLTGIRLGSIDFSNSSKFYYPFLDNKTGEIDPETWKEYKTPKSVIGDSAMISEEEIDELLCGGFHSYSHSTWNCLQGIVSWMIQEKGEAFAAHRLFRLSREMIAPWQSDICSMLYHYLDQLSDEVRGMFLSKGFSHALHERLVGEINRLKYGHEEINYYPEEKEWECDINGYEFRLPVYTDEIAAIGKKLHNCVASYIGRAVQKECTILFVRREEDLVACIEINRGGTAVMQALGNHNQWLSDELLHVVNYWRSKMSLENRTNHLEDDDYESLEPGYFSYKRLAG